MGKLGLLSDRIEFRSPLQRMGALLLAALVCGIAPVSAQDTRSSPEDRARFVSITRQLEQSPLEASLDTDRKWALNWLTEAPDVSVVVCADTIGGLLNSDYPHLPEIVVQYMFSMAAQIIEHPELTSDPLAQQLAGLEGALAAYRSILRDEPQATSPVLEGMIEARARGELPGLVRKALGNCAASEQRE